MAIATYPTTAGVLFDAFPTRHASMHVKIALCPSFQQTICWTYSTRGGGSYLLMLVRIASI
jgi:hypothetical protein